ncbi:hypothetical protein BGX28_004460 [Mortierella sp. GBA30]|nr:hypothetical protein BGX28_004460 [Mortierella sp. GBA30]
MGNVSSADHDKVNELLTRRAKKKVGAIGSRKQKQQQQRLSAGSSTSPSQSSPVAAAQTFLTPQTKSPVSTKGPKIVVDDSASPRPLPHLSQAEFYSKASADYSPLTPTSPKASFSIPASSTPSSPTYDSDVVLFTPSTHDLPTSKHSSAIIIPPRQLPDRQQQQKRNSTNEPWVSPSWHYDDSLYRQQQQQLTADLRLLGTSPEAKDWLKQKPTRSSTHMIHQYNFPSHQYYQPSGSVKAVNNICRNMSGYAHVPALHRTNTTLSPGNGSFATGEVPVFPSAASKPRPNSITAAATAIASVDNASLDASRESGVVTMKKEAPSSIPVEAKPRAPAQVPPILQTQDHFDGHFYGHGHGISTNNTPSLPLHATSKKEHRVGHLIMSRSKLNSPSASSLSSAMSTSSSHHSAGSTPGSPMDSQTPESSVMASSAMETSEKSPLNDREAARARPSSTLSSLRSLFNNHPHGLSLIEALEDEEEEKDGQDSLSDTETCDSDTDLSQRTLSLNLINDHSSSRKRPPPKFGWMEHRRRLSASSLSTISMDVKDSQKGQHALWKYIGGGNAHAPLRYDIDRILDSGCGLGEWTMEMAKEYPSATVYGIDINTELFPKASEPIPSNCFFTHSNILGRLSFPDNYFDFVYQRFLYLALTVDDWPVALKELQRVMKPGAWIELFEPCMRVHRAGHQTREVMRWISRLLQEERGLDFDFAGPKMKELCESDPIGFQNVRLERFSIPLGSWGGRVGEAMAENMALMFHNLQAALLENDARPQDAAATKAFDSMVRSWIRECEENKSYIDYYILLAQRAPLKT